MKYREDLEATARKIGQKREEALHADALQCQTKSLRGEDLLKEPLVRSRLEAATGQAEAAFPGFDENSTESASKKGGLGEKMKRGLRSSLTSPRQPSSANLNSSGQSLNPDGTVNSQGGRSSDVNGAPRQINRRRRKSIVKQDQTLDYFRDRRPNKYSGIRKPITNEQNVFKMRWKTVFLLWLVGAMTGCVHKGVKNAETLIFDLRKSLMSTVHDNYGYVVAFLVWCSFSIGLMLISLYITRIVSPVAAGSGIPQLKTILTGSRISGYLSFRTLVAKIIGLVIAVGSGMYIGQEGPFVHIASCIANCLIHTGSTLNPFKRMRENKSVKLAVLESACAVGVSSTFRSPIGGVLFSIEVTSTYYMVANYWKGFLSAISASLMSHIIDIIVNLDLKVDFDPYYSVDYISTFEAWEIPIFICMGAILGACGSATVRTQAHFGRIKSKLLGKNVTFAKEAMWTAFVGLLTASLYLCGNFSQNTYTDNIANLLTDDTLDKDNWKSFAKWDNGFGMACGLCIYFLANCLLVALSLTVSVPCGCFVPLFAGGAAFGRLVGELVSSNVSDSVLPAGYAIVGAAALTAGATRTVSVAVIAMELTGELSFLLPIFCAVFASCIVGSNYSLSIYDSILSSRNLPYLPNVVLKPNSTVSDIMTKNVPTLAKSCTGLEMLRVLRNPLDDTVDIPVVESYDTNLLHGTVSREEIEDVLRQFYCEHNLDDIESDINKDYKPPSQASTDDTLVTDTDCVEKGPKKDPKKEFERKKALLKQSHDLLHHRSLHVQAAPFILQAQTPAEDVHIIFTMLKCNGVFVLSYGMLVGVVLKQDLFDASVTKGDCEYELLYGTSSARRGGGGKKGTLSGSKSKRGMFASMLRAADDDDGDEVGERGSKDNSMVNKAGGSD